MIIGGVFRLANSKKKCRDCGEYHYTDEMININGGYFCNIDHATSYAYKNKEKGREIKYKAQKREYNENKLSTRKRAAKEACHEYIRLRDKDKTCICCGEPLGDNYHAGHFWESGNNPFLRYDEGNIHGQKASCNTFKGGDSGFYRENLIKRIGVESVVWLDTNRNNKIKRTADDYREIEAYYKEKIKELNHI